MKLTKKKALKITAELWEWLAKHPKKYKQEWPGWKKLWKMDNDCPCCEYARQEEGFRSAAGCDSCEKCPLKSVWGRSCNSVGSPWVLWFERHEKQYALQIAKAARKELKKLSRKK